MALIEEALHHFPLVSAWFPYWLGVDAVRACGSREQKSPLSRSSSAEPRTESSVCFRFSGDRASGSWDTSNWPGPRGSCSKEAEAADLSMSAAAVTESLSQVGVFMFAVAECQMFSSLKWMTLDAVGCPNVLSYAKLQIAHIRRRRTIADPISYNRCVSGVILLRSVTVPKMF